MPVGNVGFDLALNAVFFVKIFFVIFLVFYTVFSLMLFRQIQVMGQALPTQILPYLKFLAIIHIGVSLAILFLVIGVF